MGKCLLSDWLAATWLGRLWAAEEERRNDKEEGGGDEGREERKRERKMKNKRGEGQGVEEREGKGERETVVNIVKQLYSNKNEQKYLLRKIFISSQ